MIHQRLYLFFTCMFLPLILSATTIETFYGPLSIEEPLILELIESPAMQRLKSIHQYGVAYFTTHNEEYTRFDHSLGVFALLRSQHVSLEEQVAGLLHDVSHTVFSHVGDWIFGKEGTETDYQNSIHKQFLHQSGLALILEKYGLTPDEIDPHREAFPALEQPSPELCADRIDYNIQGAYHRGFLTKQEALAIFTDLRFKEGTWIATRDDLMKKLARYSLFMTEDCWGSPSNYLLSRWLADAILRALEIGIITLDDIHFGTDAIVWNQLLNTADSLIQTKMNLVLHSHQHFEMALPETADLMIYSKFRGIDPCIEKEGYQIRLTQLDPEFAHEFFSLKKKMKQGWPVVIKDHP